VKDDCGEETGKCIGFELLYSGSFSLCAEVNGNDKLRVYGGINETNFTWMLHPAESFETPQILISYSNNGIGYLSRQYANFLREKIINPQYVYKERPIVINNWEATYFNFDEKKICEIIEAASKLNIDTFVLDDGWFGNRNTDTTGLGDWFVNETKLKGGLNTIIQKCNECGMKFGLWFEPEMVSEDSNLYRAHPEFAVGKIGVEPARSRTQLVLDFTKQEVVDYVFNAVSDILKSYQIAYVKWDMNRSLSEFYSTGLEVTRQGEFSHRYVLGVYSLAERLMSAFPDIFFEGCAGGGGRFDAGMLYYFSQIWTSDNTDAIDRCKIQWGTSYAYPISAMSCHVSVCPNHQTNRTTPFSTRGAIASLGATGYELDATKLTDEEKNAVIVQIDNYKRIRDLIVHGDLYRIRNPFSGSEFCEIVVSKDKKSTYGVYLALEDSSETQVCLSGLDQKYVYRDIKTGVDYSGKLLMEEGIDIPSLKKYETYVFELKVL
jgi:alpha-galactosidase